MRLTIDMQDGNPGYFTVIKYPAGEKQVRLTKLGLEAVEKATEINILHRGVPDIMELVLLCDAVGRVAEFRDVRLILPYLPYSRADRRFVTGDCAGLAAFGQTLNGLGLSEVVTLDVHSKKAERLIPRLRNRPAEEYIELAYRAVHNISSHVTVLLPDEGSRDRYKLPAHWHVKNCTKVRDAATGKLSGFEFSGVVNEHVLIVDDICDGGGTFLGIANILPKEVRKYLYVTHGIFSKGFKELAGHFERIYTTDSLAQERAHETWGPPSVPKLLTVFPAVKDLL